MGLKEKVENNPVAWLLGVVIAGFCAGVGAYEFVTRVAGLETVSKAEIERSREEVGVVQSKLAAQAQQIRFLSLFLRYALANLEPFKFMDEYRNNEPAFRAALDDYILKFIDDSEKTVSTVAIGKGHGTQVTVTFPDGTRWDVPPGFRAATKD